MIIALFTGLVSGCNDLDEVAYSLVTEDTYTYTTKDFNPVVASSYRYIRDYVDHNNYFAAQEITADILVMPPNPSGWDDGGRYRRMHYHEWNSEQLHVKNMWNTSYQGVLICNSIINQLETGKLPAPSTEEKEKAIAEVRAMRAFYYWVICDNYGDAPLVTVPSNELPTSSTRKEIYDFIVSELTAVIPALSEEQGGKQYGRMNKWAAKTLLANVYLNAKVYIGEERWNECLAQCDDIINSGKCELSANYNASFRASGMESSREILFTVPFDRERAKVSGANALFMISWHAKLKQKFETESTPHGCGSLMGITQFINTYHPHDTRLNDTWLMGPQYAANGTQLVGSYDKKDQPFVYTKGLPDGNYTSEMEGFRMFKFEVEKGATGNWNDDYPVFRYSEVLLMKAECLLRTGKPGAGALVTEVRTRAFKDNPADAVVTDEQLKENSSYQYGYVEKYNIVDPGNTEPVALGRLLDELGWEFVFEGHRRRDMIRFGIYTKKSWLSHKPQGDYRTVFPIPESVLTSNPNLTQNPSYMN